MKRLSRTTWAWVLYDFANSAFPTTVIAGFFPILFKDYWGKGLSAADSTLWLGMAVALSSFLAALCAPLLGSMASSSGNSLRYVRVCALVGIGATMSMSILREGDWTLAFGCYVLGTLGFLLANVCYDGLLVRVSTPLNRHFISGLGFALGSLGGGVLLLFNIITVKQPHAFGFNDAGTASRAAFMETGVWWLLLALPLFFSRILAKPAVARGASQGTSAMVQLRSLLALRGSIEGRRLLLFLAAYWLYIDGVDTVIAMAVDFGKTVGFETGDLIAALLLIQFLGFPAAFANGWLAERIGVKPMLLLGIAAFALVNLAGTQLERGTLMFGPLEVSPLLVLAGSLALFLGGVQALSRSMFLGLLPKDSPDDHPLFYGVYNMVGKFAAIFGPLLVGIVGKLSGSSRVGFGSIVVLFAVGGFLLSRVRVPAEDLR